MSDMNRFCIEHKREGAYLVLDRGVENPFLTDDPLHKIFVGAVVCECPSEKTAKMILASLTIALEFSELIGRLDNWRKING